MKIPPEEVRKLRLRRVKECQSLVWFLPKATVEKRVEEGGFFGEVTSHWSECRGVSQGSGTLRPASQFATKR